MQKIPIRVLTNNEELTPKYASEEAAGADLKAAISEEMVIKPGERALIPTGIKIELPKGFEAQIRPRSGLAYKHGISLVNSPGTIDSDYRGEIGVILINHGNESFIIHPQMRIAQLVLAPVVQATFIQNAELTSSQRGEGGFGHTGTH